MSDNKSAFGAAAELQSIADLTIKINAATVRWDIKQQDAFDLRLHKELKETPPHHHLSVYSSALNRAEMANDLSARSGKRIYPGPAYNGQD